MGIDFFGDIDAVEAGEVVRVQQWSEVAQVAASLRPRATLIGGGFETQPRMVEAVRRLGPLWNLSPTECAILRDPARWSAAFQAVGLSVPEQRHGGDKLQGSDRAKRWLAKRQDTAGGSGVRLLDEKEVSEWLAREPSRLEAEYLQELIPGTPSSALFRLDQNRASCLGFFRQLCGRGEFGAEGFQYCGNIGPLPLAAGQRPQLDALGCGLRELGARGVVGVDLLDFRDRLYPIEINPRLTASGELWERSQPGVSLLGLQAAEFMNETGEPAGMWGQLSGQQAVKREAVGEIAGGLIFGKAILYWTESRPLQISSECSSWLQQAAQAGVLADIPQVGSQIEAGAPVVTLFATGATEADVLESLMREARDLRSRLRRS